MKYYFTYQMPVGRTVLAQHDGRITHIKLAKGFDKTGFLKQETPLIKKAAKQLNDYFAGRLKKFDLPLAPRGTPFQRAVWAALHAIPYGRTRTYADIARAVKNPKAARAVGGANNKNPIFIVIPCHRVIGADGSLAGFACGLGVKKKLLALEASAKTAAR
ncbi:MAG: methylated-DNA--[protein]-cysteine S-methyltransferase [Elusimicrobiota bacterium]|jgi:methylated-DNA-[protein]-cysteine S-methyltransferase|nr:methylated-DNA--[protein]-cysteine S-methyltransferase [Elusimicrobiota bacterium]